MTLAMQSGDEPCIMSLDGRVLCSKSVAFNSIEEPDEINVGFAHHHEEGSKYMKGSMRNCICK